MRFPACALLVLSGIAAAGADSGCGGDQANQGRAWFGTSEFRRAAAGFAKAIAESPDCADAHFWLGKALVRRYETANPLFAGRYVRSARRQLERAAQLDPESVDYAIELAQLYLDYPEYLPDGRVEAATLLERAPLGGHAGDELRLRLAALRLQKRGEPRRLSRALIWLTTVAGYGIPWL